MEDGNTPNAEYSLIWGYNGPVTDSVNLMYDSWKMAFKPVGKDHKKEPACLGPRRVSKSKVAMCYTFLWIAGCLLALTILGVFALLHWYGVDYAPTDMEEDWGVSACWALWTCLLWLVIVSAMFVLDLACFHKRRNDYRRLPEPTAQQRIAIIRRSG